MLGAIIGDIAGSKYEFDNTFDYNFPLFTDRNDFTDDTICTIAVADAILSGKDFASTMREWCRRYPAPMGSYGGMFGQWVFSNQAAPYNSFGNGSAMRVSAIAHLYNDEPSVILQATTSAAITHNHPEGIKGAIAVAVAIFRMRNAETKDATVFDDVAKEYYGQEAYQNLPRKGVFDVTCQGCVPLSLHIAAEADSFEDAIRRAVSYGGDTDTVAAIVGSLAEARWRIPTHLEMKALEYLPKEMKAVVEKFKTAIADSSNY